jgi:hypothetical protein
VLVSLTAVAAAVQVVDAVHPWPPSLAVQAVVTRRARLSLLLANTQARCCCCLLGVPQGLELAAAQEHGWS